ncbi:Protein phosphatase 1 regulatory subunit 27 [Exaiptasia diaphana]|nr:Protein phosphatase 1 regulatory subunit 27 [Exaiptasia diaphana]
MHGETLHRGIREDNLLLVSSILDRQTANVNAKDKQGLTALHLAAIDSNHLMAQLLLQYGADTGVVSDCGKIPLDCASDDEMVLLLAKVMAKDGKDFLLRERLKEMDKPKKLKQKINKEIQKFPPEKRILPPLASFLKSKITKKALDITDSDFKQSTESSICDSGYIGMDNESSESLVIDSLSQKNSAVTVQRRETNPVTQQELSAIHSKRNRNLEETKNSSSNNSNTNNKVRRKTHPTRTASILAQHITKPKKKKQVHFPSEILLDIAIINDEFVEACHLIKSRKVDINRPGPNGLTPLHRAAVEGSYDCLQLLLDQGAEVNAKDEYGWTALHDAVYHGNISCVAALLKAGANVTLSTDDMCSVLELTDREDVLFVVGFSLLFGDGIILFEPWENTIKPARI